MGLAELGLAIGGYLLVLLVVAFTVTCFIVTILAIKSKAWFELVLYFLLATVGLCGSLITIDYIVLGG